MKLSGILIDNFACFGPAVQWVWDEDVNDYLVRGVVADILEDSNGAGKTSLFEAVYWCLFGRTIRGVSAGEVVRDGARLAQVVTYWVLADGSIIEVERVWSKAKKAVSITTYLVDGAPEVHTYHTAAEGTEAVKALLQVDEDLFAMAVFYGRGFKTFMGLGPKERAELLNRLAKADRWLSAQAVMLGWENDARTQATTYARMADDSDSRAVDYHQQAEQFLVAAQEAEATLGARVAEVQERVTAATDKLAAVDSEQRTANAGLDKAQARYDQGQEQWSGAVRDAAKADAAWLAKSQERERAERALQKDLAASCEWCGQRLPEAAAEAQHARIQLLRNEEVATLGAKHQTAKALKVLEGERDEARTVVNLRRQELTALERERRALTATRDEGLSSIRALMAASDVGQLHAKAEARTQAAIDAEQTARDHRGVAKQQDTRRRQANFWRTGFKRVHSVVLESAFTAFEKLVNAYASNLGLDMDRVTLTTTKEGGTRTAITLTLHRGEYSRSMESLSDGEAARMNLACFFAFGDLFGQVSGVAIALRVLDEPLHGLDKSGKAAVFRTIKDTLAKDKQLFVIDHDAHFADQFTNVITVAKDADRVATVRQ